MKFPRHTFVRLKNWDSESSSFEQQNSNKEGLFKRSKSVVGSAMGSILGRRRKVSEQIKGFGALSGRQQVDDRPTKELGSRKKILHPQGTFLQNWNKIFVITCAIAVSLDPLFFYIPVIERQWKCLGIDKKLEISACILRSLTDIFYLLHILFQFRTGFIAPSSRVFGRGELIDDPCAIAKKYLTSYFIIDVLSVLPLPQVVVLIIIPRTSGPISQTTKDLLKTVILCQYVPRFIRIYPLYKEVIRTSGIFTETPWAGAAFNLFLYMLASHIVGSFWYLFTIERKDRCWARACKKNQCDKASFYCEGPEKQKNLMDGHCQNSSNLFDFGIFLDAIEAQIVETRDFSQKFFYCFWWGLQNLSSLGQNLKTSTFPGEILFAVFISILGLVLFSLLIGNMQKYLQSLTVRVEEMRVKRRDAEQWMSHRMLPENLRERIRRYEQYKWQETRGVEEEALTRNLPKDVRRDIKRHLCWSLLTRVPMFEQMDEQLLDAVCDRLKPVLYTETSFILREGDPVDEMLFVMRGNLSTVTTNGGRTGFFNSDCLAAGDFCGDELLTWALDPKSSASLPTSSRTVRAITDVEAFALVADDLKFVASQFRRRLHNKQLQQTFRQAFDLNISVMAYHSQQWKTWAACCIQAAWRRYCRGKIEKSLREEEGKLQNALTHEVGISPSLGATIYASNFASCALHAPRQHPAPSPKLPSPKLPPRPPLLALQKPSEPDFTAQGD
ncbi:hypothetical protein NMG60_11022732 [Bertholletia excelsa]